MHNKYILSKFDKMQITLKPVKSSVKIFNYLEKKRFDFRIETYN